jgi:hypothetical protein
MTLVNTRQKESLSALSGSSDDEVLGCLVEEGMPSVETDNEFLIDNEQELHQELKEP